MDKITPNYHLKLQQMCDCYLETDFEGELLQMSTAPVADPEEDSMKYLALALMYAINKQATKLSLKKKDGQIVVSIKKEDKESLPAPPAEIFAGIMKIIRAILHLEADAGEMPLSLGLRSGEVNAEVKVKQGEGKESISFSLTI